MNRSLLLLIAVSNVALAEDPAPAEATPEATPPAVAKPEPYTLKNRSNFTLTAEQRAPFLPIGWVKSQRTVAAPKKVGIAVAPKALELRPEHFTLTSVLIGQPGQVSLATINGRSFAEGDVFPVTFNGQNLKVVLRSIRDGGVVLEYEQKFVTVKLKRQEAVERPPGDPEKLKEKENGIVIETGPQPKAPPRPVPAPVPQ